MTEPILPSYSYPFAQYSAYVVQANLPIIGNQPVWTEVVQGGYIASGKQEVVRLRTEETRKIQFFGNEREANEWLQFHRDVSFRGKQFQFLVNKYTGMQVTFENTFQDIAGDLPSSMTAAVSYTQVGDKIALVPTSGRTVNFSWASSLQSAGGENGGTVVITFVPLVLTSASGPHTFIHITSDGQEFFLGTGGNSDLQFNINSNPTSIHLVRVQSYSWTAGVDVVTLIAKYTTMSLTLWASKNGSPFQVSTLTEGVGSPINLSKGGGLIGIGGQAFDYTYVGALKVLHFATYRYPFQDPTILSSYFLVGRNYYNKAELVDQSLEVTRVNPGVNLYNITMTIRQGL